MIAKLIESGRILALGAVAAGCLCSTAAPCPERSLNVVNVSDVGGRRVEAPVWMKGLGDENALSFSLSFDPARLTYLGEAIGAGASGASLVVNNSQVASGKIGYVIAKSPGQVFASGSNQLVKVLFQLGQTPATTSLAFSDAPIAREVVNGSAVPVCFSSTNGTVNILTLVGPSITTGPQSRTVQPIEGVPTNVTFTVSATGSAPLGYQWRFNSAPLAWGTSALITLSNVTVAAAGSYDVIVANDGGSVTSAPAALAVLPPLVRPSILVHPRSQIVSTGETVSLSVEAQGSAPLTYQWTKGGVNVSGATGSTLSFTNITASQGGTYAVKVSNAGGSVTSQNASLSVSSSVRKVRVAARSVATGGSVEVPIELVGLGDENSAGFSFSFDPARLTFQGVQPGAASIGAGFLVNTNELASGRVGVAITRSAGMSYPAGVSELALVQFKAGDQSGPASVAFGDQPISREIADAWGNPRLAVFENGSVNVLATGPSIVQQPQSASAWIFTNFSFKAQTAGSVPLYLQWQKDGVPLVGETSEMLVINKVTPSHAGAYRLIVSNAVGAVTSSIANLRVDRVVRLGSTNAPTGNVIDVPVELLCSGVENGLGFSLDYDPAQMSVLDVLPGSAVGASGLNWNMNQPGRLGVLLARPANAAFSFGTQQVAFVRLNLSSNVANVGPRALTFGDAPVLRELADTNARPLTVTFAAPSVSVYAASPVITAQPEAQTVWAGSNVTFSVVAEGSKPMTWQWLFNGNPIPNATNEILVLPNTQPNQAGRYSVQVKSPAGTEVSSGALLTVLIPRPDFFVNNLAAPANAMAGQLVQLTWNLHNVGNAASEPGWAHTLWLARDTAGSAPEFVASIPQLTSLAPGQSLSVTGAVIIPSSAMGDRYFMVRADSSNSVTELNEANNSHVSAAKIHITSGDLFARSISGPSSATLGGSISVAWSVSNQGSSAASVVWRDSIYLSTNETSLAGATRLLLVAGKGAPATPNLLGPGSSYTNTQTVILPSGSLLKPGSYYLAAVADVFNDLPETDETNNIVRRPISLTAAPLPDLLVSSMTVPAVAQPGQQSVISWAVTNSGNATAAGLWRETLLASNSISGIKPIAQWDFTNTLPVAALAWRTQTVVWPFSGPSGDTRLLVHVDAREEIEEQTETNNVTYATASTLVPQSLKLGLAVSQIAEDSANPVVRASLTRNGDVSVPLQFSFHVSDRSAVSGPTNLVIPAGQETISFDLRALDDNVVTENRSVLFLASAPGYPNAEASLLVLNTDVPRLTLYMDNTAVIEGQSVAATVMRDVVNDQPLTVLLQSSAPGQLSVPLSVTIPAGAPTWTFPILAVDDDVVETEASYTASVSAAGFNAGSASVIVVDNDLPAVTLSLSERVVSESGGPQATFATVRRWPVSTKPVSIDIETSDPTAARTPARVVIPAYSETTSFPVAAIDDLLVDGAQTVQLTPFALSASGVRMNAGTPDTLTVTDDDGPTLFVSLDKKLVGEGLSPAATVKVERNTPATNALTVSLHSSDSNEAAVAASVIIPVGTNAAYVALSSIADGVHDGDKPVSITAEAPGYTAGSASIVVSDSDLPDLSVASVTLPATVETEGYFTVGYRIENQGLAAAYTNSTSGMAFTTRVYLSRDPVVGEDVLVGQFPFNGNLLAGAHTDQTLAVRAPLTSGEYWVVVQTDAALEQAEIREDNNTGISRSPILVMVGYDVTVQTDIDAALPGTHIPMSGIALLPGGAPAANKPVNVHVVTRGTDRVVAAITGPDGRFALNWIPLPGEAGIYEIFATHPGVTIAPVQDEFRLLGLHAQPASVSLTMNEQATATGSVRLVNDSDQPLTGVAAVVLEQPPGLGVSINLPGGTLSGSGHLDLAYSFTATNANAYGYVKVRVTTAQGLGVDIPFAVSVTPLRPHLVANPSSLTAGMARGRQTTVEFALVNNGSIPSGPVSVVVPNVPWLTVISPNPLPPVQPGETNGVKVTLLLQPAADMPLGPYNGSIALNSTNAGVTVPFTFRALSEAKGDLLITAVDELTYYAAGAPNLAGASVTIADAVTRQTVASGVTDTNGLFYVPGLPESYYDITLSADKHTTYRGTHLVHAGLTNEISAFLSRQVVTYTWTVEPVAIEDNYKITVETTFETVVPLPVVTIEPAVIDLGKITAEVTQVELKVSNQGLIAANNTRLSFPTHPLWEFVPLVENLGVLPAKSSLTIPVVIRKVAPSAAAMKDGSQGACHLSAGVCWDLECGGKNNSYCGGIAMPNAQSGCGGTTPGVSIPTYSGVPTGGGGGVGGGTIGSVYVSTPSFSTPTVCNCEKLPKICIDGEGGFSVDGFATKLAGAVTRFLPNFSVKEVEVKVHAEGNLCTCCKNDQLSWEGNASAGADIKMVLRAGPSFSGSLGFDGGAGWSGVSAEVDAMAGLEVTISGSVSGSLLRKCMEEPDACLAGSIGFSLFAGAQINGEVQATFSDGIQYSGSVSGQLGLQGSASASLSGCVREGIKMSVCGEIKALANASGTLKATIGGQEVTRSISISADQVIAQAGCTSEAKSDGPIVDTIQPEDLLTPESNVAEALGISAVPPSGICAQVKLKTEQEAVISRDAFRATLEIGNADTVRLEQLQAEVIVRDSSGTDVTPMFGIRSPELVGITAVDGTGILPAQSTGTAKWIIIPTSDAAPTSSQQYFVSGKLRYTQGGALITVPLAPVSITVLPNPKLVVHYFHDRDVFSDDPFTEAVEPSIPFNLAVMIQNQGYGMARNMRITSAQPQIMENERGLLIDFKIIATEVAGKNMVPSLTADFGDINPNQTVVGRWLMTSTLQGLFIDYKASFEHVDALNNPKLSLIDSVHIHEMNHLVYAAGTFDDGKPDFLVNEVQDLHDRPDTLWLSDGRTFPVSAVEQGTVSATPAANRLQVQLTASMPEGWAYLRIPEPSNGSLRLKRVERSDGIVVGVGTNAWVTDRTFVGMQRPPTREQILHILDYNGTGTYTLTYEVMAPADTTAPTSSVAALPAQASGQIPVSWAGQDDENGSGVAHYDIYVSVNGGLFTPWLLNTTASGAAYTGSQNSSYAFYSIATDRAGNREPAPATPDAQTTVNIVNRTPEISAVPVQIIDEGIELNYVVSATDPDLPSDRLSFSISGEPAGMRIDAATGAIRWLTSEATGPSTNLVSVTVRDAGVPQLSASTVLKVIVREVNKAPSLSAIANVVINEGALLSITNSASDTDLPANALTFSLVSGVPQGVTIHPATGILTWRPTELQGPSTNVIKVVVSDNGSPSLSATQQFFVTVRDQMSDFILSLGSTNLFVGESNSVPLVLKSSLELSQLSFRVQPPQDKLTNAWLALESPEIISAGVVPLTGDEWQVSLTLDPSLSAASIRQLASLQFTARNSGTSAIVPLPLSNPVGLAVGGRVITNASALPGQVIIIDREPILTLQNPARPLLKIYGVPGKSYILQHTPSLETPNWSQISIFQVTNRIESLNLLDLEDTGFLRLREQ